MSELVPCPLCGAPDPIRAEDTFSNAKISLHLICHKPACDHHVTVVEPKPGFWKDNSIDGEALLLKTWNDTATALSNLPATD